MSVSVVHSMQAKRMARRICAVAAVSGKPCIDTSFEWTCEKPCKLDEMCAGVCVPDGQDVASAAAYIVLASLLCRQASKEYMADISRDLIMCVNPRVDAARAHAAALSGDVSVIGASVGDAAVREAMEDMLAHSLESVGNTTTSAVSWANVDAGSLAHARDIGVCITFGAAREPDTPVSKPALASADIRLEDTGDVTITREAGNETRESADEKDAQAEIERLRAEVGRLKGELARVAETVPDNGQDKPNDEQETANNEDDGQDKPDNGQDKPNDEQETANNEDDGQDKPDCAASWIQSNMNQTRRLLMLWHKTDDQSKKDRAVSLIVKTLDDPDAPRRAYADAVRRLDPEVYRLIAHYV